MENDGNVNEQLPPPWETIDEHFPVARCGILVSGRKPSSPELVDGWVDACDRTLEQIESSGIAVPKMTLSRWDPTRDEVVTADRNQGTQQAEIAKLLALGLDGSLSWSGQARGAAPNLPFVYEADCWALLDPPDWISLGLDVTFVAELSAADQVDITGHLIDLVRTASNDPHVHYAEVSPQALAGYRGATPWEDDLEPDCFGAGLRLAPRWLRGVGSVTFVSDETLERLTDRPALERSQDFVSVIECPRGLLLVDRPNLWSEDSEHDSKIRSLVSERLVRDDILQEAMAFAANWQSGSTAVEMDRYFEERDS